MKLRVTCKKERLWRAGKLWTRQGVEVETSIFTAAQLLALKDEPLPVWDDTWPEELKRENCRQALPLARIGGTPEAVFRGLWLAGLTSPATADGSHPADGRWQATGWWAFLIEGIPLADGTLWADGQELAGGQHWATFRPIVEFPPEDTLSGRHVDLFQRAIRSRKRKAGHVRGINVLVQMFADGSSGGFFADGTVNADGTLNAGSVPFADGYELNTIGGFA